MTEPRWNLDPESDQSAESGPEDLPLEEVRRAVREERVFLVYQPILSFEPRRLVGAEALARWVHREWGMVSPGVFLPRVEEAGLMVELSRRLLREACRNAREWPPAGPASRGKELLLQFNLSAADLDDPDLPAALREILDEEDFPPRRLRLELGGEAVRDHPHLMRELASMGLSLVVHDYGIRDEGLADEGDLGIEAIKIDRSVIEGLGNVPEVREMVERAVALGHERGLEVVAEGVETEAQVWHLQRLGCELGQGFRLEAPMRADQFQRFCEERWR